MERGDKKALLINPSFPVADGITHLPLCLAYIGAMYLKEDVEVKALDLAMEEDWKYKRLAEVTDFLPDITIIRCYFAKAFYYASETAKEVKKLWPNTLVVIEGMHPTFVPKEILERFKEFDVVIIHEPEKQAIELLKYIKGEKLLKDIKGIAYRKNDKVYMNALMPLLNNLDSLPFPARTLFPYKKYYKKDFETTLRGGRGCLFNCKFCLQSKMARNLRLRKIEMIIKEIKTIVDLGFKSIFFEDENFTTYKERVIIFCEQKIKSKLNIKWSCNSRISDYNKSDPLTKKMLSAMKKSNCYRVFCGIESFNNLFLNNINKKLKIDQVQESIKLIQSFDIEVHGSFIVGLPGMNNEDHVRLAKFVKTLDLDMVSFNVMTPYPGTEFCSEADKLGITIPDKYWYEKKDWYKHPIAGTLQIQPDKMDTVLREVYLNYFLNKD